MLSVNVYCRFVIVCMFSAIVHNLRVSIGRVSVIVNCRIGNLGELSVIA